MLGLTLEGGGAKGAYQIGAWRALRELNIEFQGITGTSVGALNGAMIIQDDFDTAYELWHEITPNQVLDIDDRIYEMIADYDLNSNNLQLLLDEMKRAVKGFGFDTKPLEKLVQQNIKEEKLRQSKMDFGFVTVCLSDRKPMEIFKEDVPQGKMGDYLIASSYLPIFKSKKLDGKLFLDGAFYNNLPIDMLYNRGYRKIIAVRLLGKGRVKKIDFPDLEVVYIIPRENLGSMMDFTRDRARHNLKLGYLDTMRAMKELRGKKYYLQGAMDEEKAFQFFLELGEACIKELGVQFGLPQWMPLNRLLMEEIIPKLAYLTDCRKGATYGEIIEGLLEGAASHLEIDPYTIYTLDELIQQITENGSIKGGTPSDPKNGFILNEIILRLDKEKQLKEAVKILLSHGHFSIL